MSLKIVELNDISPVVGDSAGIVSAGPAFALLREKQLILGSEAERQHRIHPTSSHDKFWHELNMEPLQIRSRIRHHADLAYSHLLELAREAEIDDEAIFAVPGHYDRRQLGLLLGIANQCRLRVSGLVDAALAAAADALANADANLRDRDSLVHVGLHLHQVLLTRLFRRDGELTVDQVVQVPQLGRQQLLEALLRIANGAFVRQCRFNPQRDADCEQALYGILATWIDGADEPANNPNNRGNLVMELKAGDVSHTAKLPRDQLLAGLQKPYGRLLQSLRPLLESPAAGILLDHRLARVPGALAAIGETGTVRVARAEAATEICLRHSNLITGGEGVNKIRALPVASESTPPLNPRKESAPTHVLFRNRALPVADLPVVNQPNGAGYGELALRAPGPTATFGRIRAQGAAVSFDCGELEFRLNDVPVKGSQVLKLGDRIRLSGVADELLLIEVRDGR